MSDLEINFRLPLGDWPRAVFRSNYLYDGGELWVGDVAVLTASSRAALERGVRATLPGSDTPVGMRLDASEPVPVMRVDAAHRPALREDELSAPPSRSAWIHACQALGASFFGFVAGYLYLRRAELTESAWALKMSYHTAGWHLLLTFTLFPASVWGQRLGIRTVQLVSLIFFCIHVGMSIANAGSGEGDDPWIALFNALSGLLFGVAVIYGQRAWRDMDPMAALREGRA